MFSLGEFYTEWRPLATVLRDAGESLISVRSGCGGLYNRCMTIGRTAPGPVKFPRFWNGGLPTLVLLGLPLLISACRASPAGTATTSEGSTPSTSIAVSSVGVGNTPAIPGTTAVLFPTEVPALTGTPLPFGSCSDGLAFMGDLTYPDRTKVLPGLPLEKRWKVRNSGLCDWAPEYRFRWTGGTKLATQDEFALYPAVAGSEAVIAIPMTAPSAAGEYTSDWRAFSPLGVPFGDTLYIDIIVTP
jgi:hypothetical protein